MKRPVRMEVHLELADGFNDLDVARVLRAAFGPAVKVDRSITTYGAPYVAPSRRPSP